MFVFFFSLFLRFFYMKPILKNPVRDINLEKYSSFEFTIPYDTFEEEDSTRYTGLSKNEWITVNLVNPIVDDYHPFIKVDDFDVKGDILYIVNGYRGMLYIVDISGEDFQLLGTLYHDGSVTCVAVSGDRLYIGYQFSDVAFRVVNITDRRHPSVISEVLTSTGWVRSFSMTMHDEDENFVLVAGNLGSGDNELIVVNVTDDENPFVCGNVATTTPLVVEYSRGAYVFAYDIIKFYVIDVNDKTSPQIASFRFENGIAGVFVDESSEYAYIITGSKMRIFDVRTKTVEPSLVGELPSIYGAKCICTVNNITFVGTDSDGIVAINTTFKTTPSLVESISPERTEMVKRLGESKIIADHQYRGISIFDISSLPNNYADPPFTNPLNYFGYDAVKIFLYNQYLYVADYMGGLKVFDVSYRKSSQMVGMVGRKQSEFQGGAPVNDVKVRDRYIFAVSSGEMIVFEQSSLNLDNPLEYRLNFTEISKLELTNPRIIDLDSSGNFAYIGHQILSNYYLGIINATDLKNISVVSNLEMEFSIQNMMFVNDYKDRGDLIYVTMSSYFSVINVSNKEEPFIVANNAVGDSLYYDIVIKDSFAYVAADTDGLVVWNITDFENMKIVGKADTVAARAIDISLSEDIVVIADSKDGLKVVDVSDKTNPIVSDFNFVGDYDATDVVMRGNVVYLSSNNLGYRAIRFDLRITGSKTTFSYFCGSSNLELYSWDLVSGESETVTDIFKLTRRDYCSGHGQCLPNFKCTCDDGYYGDNCESWACHYIDYKDFSKVCNAHGKCTGPNECECRKYFEGQECETNTLLNFVVIPIVAVFGSVLIFCVALLGIGMLCCIVLCCCSVFMSVVSSLLCCIFWGFLVVSNQRRGLAKFSKLKNFDLLLKEQELENDVSIAHLDIKKDLYTVDFDEIKVIRIIGEGGSSSIVFEAQWNDTTIAFKCFKTSLVCESQSRFDEFEKEVEVLGSVNHPNILRFFGCSLKPPRVGILMEFCRNGDLQRYFEKKIEEKVQVPFPVKLRFCFEIVLPMAYLHSRNVIHRDIKLENVLLADDFSCRLMDFGLSRIVESMSQVKTSRIGTSYFMAPEVLGEEYDEKVDVFAFGVCAYMIFSEVLHPYGINQYNIELKVANDPNYRPNLDLLDKKVVGDQKETLDFIKGVCAKSWDHDPKNRPSFSSLSGPLKELIGRYNSGEQREDAISIIGGEEERRKDNNYVVVQKQKKGSFQKDNSISGLLKELDEEIQLQGGKSPGDVSSVLVGKWIDGLRGNIYNLQLIQQKLKK